VRKKFISIILAMVLLLSAVPISTSFAADDADYHDKIGTLYETVIEIEGISKSYTFMQIADSHVVNIPTNTSDFYYNDAITRFNHFKNLGGGVYSALDRFNALYDYAEDPANGIDGVWLSGDNIDFPSAENTSFITNKLINMSIDHMYCMGNHDWTYPTHYFDTYGRNNYRPLLKTAMNENTYINYQDYGDFGVVAIDNSENYIYYQAVVDGLKNTVIPANKPVLVFLHVPIYNKDLQNYCYSVWGTDETMNPNSAKYPNNEYTKYVYNWITTNPNVVAVFAGHLHINYEGTIAGGKPQYVTSGGYLGDARLITVKPTTCEVHTWDEGEVIKAPTTKPGETFHTCTVCGATETVVTPAIYMYGDVNGDGEVSAKDSMFIRRHLARADVLIDEGQKYSADVNDDGKINAKDSLMLRRYLAGHISSLG